MWYFYKRKKDILISKNIFLNYLLSKNTDLPGQPITFGSYQESPVFRYRECQDNIL